MVTIIYNYENPFEKLVMYYIKPKDKVRFVYKLINIIDYSL